MKAYKLIKRNRWEERNEEVIYLNKEKAEKEVKKILDKYNRAVKKGSGIHWGNVDYNSAWIEEIEIIE